MKREIAGTLILLLAVGWAGCSGSGPFDDEGVSGDGSSSAACPAVVFDAENRGGVPEALLRDGAYVYWYDEAEVSRKRLYEDSAETLADGLSKDGPLLAGPSSMYTFDGTGWRDAEHDGIIHRIAKDGGSVVTTRVHGEHFVVAKRATVDGDHLYWTDARLDRTYSNDQPRSYIHRVAVDEGGAANGREIEDREFDTILDMAVAPVRNRLYWIESYQGLDFTLYTLDTERSDSPERLAEFDRPPLENAIHPIGRRVAVVHPEKVDLYKRGGERIGTYKRYDPGDRTTHSEDGSLYWLEPAGDASAFDLRRLKGTEVSTAGRYAFEAGEDLRWDTDGERVFVYDGNERIVAHCPVGEE